MRCSYSSVSQSVSVGFGNDLEANRRQAITWSNDKLICKYELYRPRTAFLDFSAIMKKTRVMELSRYDQSWSIFVWQSQIWHQLKSNTRDNTNRNQLPPYKHNILLHHSKSVLDLFLSEFLYYISILQPWKEHIAIVEWARFTYGISML